MTNRKNFNLSDDHAALTKDVKPLIGSKSDSETVQEALVLYAWFVMQRAEGRKVGSIDEINKVFQRDHQHWSHERRQTPARQSTYPL